MRTIEQARRRAAYAAAVGPEAFAASAAYRRPLTVAEGRELLQRWRERHPKVAAAWAAEKSLTTEPQPAILKG